MKLPNIKDIVNAAGGPLAALMNPNVMKTLGENVGAFMGALPPAPIMAAAAMSLLRTALVTEWKKADPSPGFMDMCRASGRFTNDYGIVNFRNVLLEEL